MTLPADDRELTLDEFRAISPPEMSDKDVRSAHVKLYGVPARRAKLISRSDWSTVKSSDFGRGFPMCNGIDEFGREEIEALCASVRNGHVTLDVIGIIARPKCLFTAQDQSIYRQSRGKESHRTTCVNVFRWLSACHSSQEVRMESRYPAGRYDVGVPGVNLAAECGYTKVSKINKALRHGWTVVSVPYHLAEGLVAFRFAPVHVDILNAEKTSRRVDRQRKNRENFRLRMIAAGGTSRINGYAHCSDAEAHTRTVACVNGATCAGDPDRPPDYNVLKWKYGMF